MEMYDAIGLGIASLDLIGVSASPPELGAKQGLAEWVEMGGGPVATAMAAMARLGASVCMAGAVGSDHYGQRILADLRAASVATSGMASHPGSSHIAFVLAEPGQDRRTIWWHNDPHVLAAVQLQPDLFRHTRALLIDTHMPAQARSAAGWVRAAGGLVMLDADRIRPGTRELLPLCDMLVVSARFGREATATAEPADAARLLAAQYGAIAVVTCGAAGSWCAHGDALFHTSAYPIDPIDTTGCGDVFHGALLYAHLRGDQLGAALRFASAAAALKCRGLGGRGALPTCAEVEALIGSTASGRPTATPAPADAPRLEHELAAAQGDALEQPDRQEHCDGKAPP